ncbi:Uu.00g137260.m01.CDS01 [Anthostomella pinea]|uniref:Uu.00g137260.m01.CDS01 n=1 Tax=Anthostomella pinea TaxID=933095 RepID=A0AAI8VPJ2_9PEZI|nr:Uu.00g137260.m01.CDS01 [Anthostomella pinea]
MNRQIIQQGPVLFVDLSSPTAADGALAEAREDYYTLYDDGSFNISECIDLTAEEHGDDGLGEEEKAYERILRESHFTSTNATKNARARHAYSAIPNLTAPSAKAHSLDESYQAFADMIFVMDVSRDR